MESALLRFMWHTLQTLVMLLSFLGPGLILMRLFFPELRELKDVLFLGIALGSGVIAVYTLGISFLGLVYPITSWIIMVLGLLGIIINWQHIIVPMKSTWDALSYDNKKGYYVLLSILLLLYFIFYLASITPVIAGDIYKFEIGKLIVKYHKMVSRPDIVLSEMPNLEGMLFVYCQSLFGFDSIKIVCFLLGVAFCMCVYNVARSYLSREGSFITAILITLIPPFYQELYEINQDIGWALWGLAGIYLTLYLLKRQYEKIGAYVLVGFLLGCAASGKLIGPIIPMVVCLFILLPFKAHSEILSFKTRLRIATVIALCSIMVVLPWYIKSYIFTGDPFYPYGTTFFKTKSEFLSLEAAARVFSVSAHYDPLSRNNWRIILFLIYWSFPILYRPIEPYWIHPFIITFIPLYFFAPESNKIKDYRLWFLALGISMPIVIISQLIRFNYISITIFTILAIAIYESLGKIYFIKKAFRIALSVFIIFSFFTILHKTNHNFQYTFGLMNKKEYILRYSERWANNPYAKTELWIDENLPENTKLLISGVNEWMGFLTNRERWDLYDLESYLKWHKLPISKDAIYDALREKGIKYILLYGKRYDHPAICKIIMDLYNNGKIKIIYQDVNDQENVEKTTIFQVY